MAKTAVRFVCNACGGVQPKWMGKCPDCGAWDALEELRTEPGAKRDPYANGVSSGGGAPQALPIGEIDESTGDLAGRRFSTGIGELDRVLGGAGDRRGLVPGSVVLLGGDPGIGKSTLMLQAAGRLAAGGHDVLYVTSEESGGQLRGRAERLLPAPLPERLQVLADTNLARILEQARRVGPGVMVIDSVQMIYKGDLPAAPGSVSQLRAACMELVHFAKTAGVCLLLVGHVTKQGGLAGPKLLEHMVDAVLSFEGDRYHAHRVVRGIKNRFGNTLEVGLFEMTESGLTEVADGSGLLAAEYAARSGSVVCPVLSGSRCLLVEVQALTATGFLGSAKRKVSGLDGSRLAMLIAVLEKHGGLRLADQDVFASAVGGMRVAEPAADLAVALAIAGAHLNRGPGEGVAVVGEIGLGGEVRAVQQLPRRLAEAGRLGFKQVLGPRIKGLTPPPGVQLVGVGKLSEGIEALG